MPPAVRSVDGVTTLDEVVGAGVVVAVVTSAESEVQATANTAMTTSGRRIARLTSSIVPDIPNHPSTVMVPVIFGWIWQK